MSNVGPMAFVGGAEWQAGCTFDQRLLAASGSNEVLVLPTAAAYEHPQRKVDQAQEYFAAMGAQVVGLDVLQRRDAEMPEHVDAVRRARFLYLSDGSPLHLRSVLKDSALWQAILDAWRNGAVIAGSSAGATIFGDPMLDPRGGAFTLGLGPLRRFALVPHWGRWTGEGARRMTSLMPAGMVVAEVAEQTALIRLPDGTWEAAGAGSVTLTLDHHPLEIADLATSVIVDEATAVPSS